MHEYELLYQKWKRYRFKKTLFKLVVTSLLFIIVAGIPYYFFEKAKTSTPAADTNHPQPQKNILYPDKTFEQYITKYTTQKTKIRNVPSKSFTPKHKNSHEEPLFIRSQKSTISELKKSFDIYPTAPKALIIAKRYYAKGQYKNAAKWAYKANTLDKNNEESWLLFAKSLTKDGKKRKAAAILKIYYKKSGSTQAKLLLQKILNGEFR